jgi:hypothetical protein
MRSTVRHTGSAEDIPQMMPPVGDSDLRLPFPCVPEEILGIAVDDG